MGRYTQYIQEHINNYYGQLSFHWKTPGYWRRLIIVCSRYREMHGTNDLLESINRLGDRIGREDVRNLFIDKKYYDGYVATMLWGGIDLTRRNDIQETNGYKALTIKKDIIVEKLERVANLLLVNNLPKAFSSFLDNGENHIEGVGLSYFSKLLFFIPNNISPNPLIYDKWGVRIHAALMKDENKNYNDFLSIYDPQPFIRGGNDRNVLFRSYLDYCSRINNLYGSLNIDSNKDIEAFLFGMPLKGAIGNDSERNPRKMLKDYLGLDNRNKHTPTTPTAKENFANGHKIEGHSTEFTSINIPDEFINSIQDEFHDINISRNKTIYGIKTQVATELSSGWTLAVGVKKTFYFCGMYHNGQNISNPYPEVFTIARTAGVYEKFNALQEALNQFEDILRKESKKQND